MRARTVRALSPVAFRLVAFGKVRQLDGCYAAGQNRWSAQSPVKWATRPCPSFSLWLESIVRCVELGDLNTSLRGRSIPAFAKTAIALEVPRSQAVSGNGIYSNRDLLPLLKCSPSVRLPVRVTDGQFTAIVALKRCAVSFFRRKREPISSRQHQGWPAALLRIDDGTPISAQ
jgi:hypothetical protein